MRYLDRYYIRKCRLSAVRLAGSRHSPCMGRRWRIRLALGLAAFLEMLWATGMVRHLPRDIKSLVKVQRIQEQIQIPDSYNLIAGPGEAGCKSTVKEGINIRLDEKDISIFWLKKSKEQVNN